MSKESLYEKGMDFFLNDELDKAAAEFEKALEVDLEYGDALHAIAMTHYHSGNMNEAIEFGERFRMAEPENVHAYTSLSMFYNAKGSIEKAEEMGAMASQLAAGQEDPHPGG
jgi:tetratricopeptide (TPR) repeat protein